ncbi:filamentous hemagglutinin N-terminal domain-containing protein [Baaleninema sp.]|uniref:two-partner secretion domain-containing protein n=1 Tax=Baaleninema sp. TaxID=3101197 RepID=UPI003CFD93F4
MEGGTQAGNNLFQSFDRFLINTNTEVNFNNSIQIKNIIARVTGGEISTIDGLLKTPPHGSDELVR